MKLPLLVMYRKQREIQTQPDHTGTLLRVMWDWKCTNYADAQIDKNSLKTELVQRKTSDSTCVFLQMIILQICHCLCTAWQDFSPLSPGCQHWGNTAPWQYSTTLIWLFFFFLFLYNKHLLLPKRLKHFSNRNWVGCQRTEHFRRQISPGALVILSLQSIIVSLWLTNLFIRRKQVWHELRRNCVHKLRAHGSVWSLYFHNDKRFTYSENKFDTNKRQIWVSVSASSSPFSIWAIQFWIKNKDWGQACMLVFAWSLSIIISNSIY